MPKPCMPTIIYGSWVKSAPLAKIWKKPSTGENYEVVSMYPEFMKDAEEADDRKAFNVLPPGL